MITFIPLKEFDFKLKKEIKNRLLSEGYKLKYSGRRKGFYIT